MEFIGSMSSVVFMYSNEFYKVLINFMWDITFKCLLHELSQFQWVNIFNLQNIKRFKYSTQNFFAKITVLINFFRPVDKAPSLFFS